MSRSFDDSNSKHVGDAIRQLLKTYHLDSKFDAAAVVASWERLFGKPVARHTRRIFLKNKVLFVELDSPGMKNDLSLHKKQMLQAIHQEFGADSVAEIVFM
jgi:predicted nucleic acid-binding Zn ribbon protein